MPQSHVTNWTASTDSSLLRRARDHQPNAWAQLVDIYGPLVYGWCRRTRLQPADAADVVQEVFAALATGLPRFERRDTGSLRAWLRAVTLNKVRDHGRRRRHGPESPGGTTAGLRMQEVADHDDPSDEDSEPSLSEGVARLTRRSSSFGPRSRTGPGRSSGGRRSTNNRRPTSPRSWG